MTEADGGREVDTEVHQAGIIHVHGADSMEARPESGSVDLYWLPLGAGGHFVRWNGRIFEAMSALLERRPTQDLFHSALEVRLNQQRYVIEMGPVWNVASSGRGVVCEGPVGARWLGRYRIFRYEVRAWLDGSIPDAAEAVESPKRLSEDPRQAARLLDLLREVPSLTWGRDELESGDMWNSNSLASCLLASSGHDIDALQPPAGGRAPGWHAGLTLASRMGAASAPNSLPERAEEDPVTATF